MSNKFDIKVIPAEIISIQDGDTIKTRPEKGHGLREEEWVRFRGVDAPEKSSNPKAERDLDRIPSRQLYPLGKASQKRLEELVLGRKIFLHCETRDGSKKPYLYHNQFRLLAYVSLDSLKGPDVGKTLLEEGYSLVWPRGNSHPRYQHPKILEYISTCKNARNSNSGLWKKTLWKLCPLGELSDSEATLRECTMHCHPAYYSMEYADKILSELATEVVEYIDDDQDTPYLEERELISFLLETGALYGFRLRAGDRGFLKKLSSGTELPDIDDKRIAVEIIALLAQKMISLEREYRAELFQLLCALFAIALDEPVEDTCGVTEATIRNYKHTGPSDAVINSIQTRVYDEHYSGAHPTSIR